MMAMKTYMFASLRGSDVIIDGFTPEDAWSRLCKREKENGSLWKTGDVLRNRCAVEQQGFYYLDSVAYKEVTRS